MVESTALEMRRALTGTVGSNPTLSAIFSEVVIFQLLVWLGRSRVSRSVSRSAEV